MKKTSILLVACALAATAVVAQEKDRSGEDARVRADLFSKERCAARRQRLVKNLGAGAVVIVKQRPIGIEEIEEWRPSTDLLYLTGLREPNLTLVLAKGEEVLFAPPRDRMAERWRGERLFPGEATAKSLGLSRALANDELRGFLAEAVAEAETVYLAGLTREQLLELVPAARERRTENASKPIGLLRQIKDDAELLALRRAVDVSNAGHVEAMRSVGPGKFEYEVQAVAEYVFRRYGAERQGYASIVGSGPNSCILHYSANRRRAMAGDVICADMGAEVAGYTADVTRTFPVSGKFTPEQRKIYDIVLRAQEAAIAEVKPGSTIAKVHARARAVIAEAGYGAYFPHGTSHWLGLDVHDVGDYARPFEPGMVLTVEPGIYIPEKEIGVRIEDDLVVTQEGSLNLTAGLAKTADAIEALVQEGSGVGARPVAPLAPLEPLPAPRKGRVY